MSTKTNQPLNLAPLPRVLLEPLVRATLLEDLGRSGDITSDAVISSHVQSHLVLRARQKGVLAGLDVAKLAFELVDSNIKIQSFLQDGARLSPGDCIAEISGSAREILIAERSALNFLGLMSGVASATRRLADLIEPYKAKVTCTRKTLPGLRCVQKYAVRAGGGSNHRFGLDDAILIKDNHIAIAGSLTAAVERVRANAGHMVQMEVEVDTLIQLQEALDLQVGVILLDNMDTTTLREAVQLVNGRATTEASGRVSEKTIVEIAATGVDLIAVGAITHSAPVLDIGLDAA